jgi:DNA-binding protein H-NS
MEEQNKLDEELHDLQHMVSNLREQLQEAQEQNTIAMSNELAAYRELVPYLLVERANLRGMVGNG